jgi:hypothetical protein
MRRRLVAHSCEHLPLVGEFAFQVQSDRKEDIAAKQKKLAAQLYITLQREVGVVIGR